MERRVDGIADEDGVETLEGGVAALALSSGQAASAFALQNIARFFDIVRARSALLVELGLLALAAVFAVVVARLIEGGQRAQGELRTRTGLPVS